MVDHLEPRSKPTPMLEQELSQDTLNAIKAIVSGDPKEAPASKTSVTTPEVLVLTAADFVPKSGVDTAPPADACSDEQADLENESELAEIMPAEEIDDLAVQTTSYKADEIVKDAEPDIELELIRSAIEDSEVIAPEPLPEAGVVPPPGIGLRLKRHLRNKIRMHFLIVKMKLRDRLPTKKEVIKSMTPRRLAITIMIATALIEPWFYPTALVLILFFGSLVLLLMGPDRVRHYADLAWRRYKRLNPEKALELRARAMDLFERWQSKVDRLPSRWTQGLHMPQFQSEAEKSAAESAYAVRMARIAQDERPKSYP